MQSDVPERQTPLSGLPARTSLLPSVGSTPSTLIDQAAPNAARIYDWLLGGKDNYDADRQAARRLLRAVPEARQAARDNRAYLARVVRFLAGAGITQFLDIGSGLPAAGPVHEIARQTCPGARVAYVDHDPVVLAHARALLASHDLGVAAVPADLRDPAVLLTDRAVRELIDFDRPVAVLLIAVLHFITDADDPRGIIRAITSQLAPGSYVAVSHVTADDLDPDAALAARAAYGSASVPGVARSRAEVTGFLAGLDLAPPGVTDVRRWRRPGPRPAPPVLFWAAAGRVRDPGRAR
jgi:SAM-dependent methyltransferase